MGNLVGITLSKAELVDLVSGVRAAMSRDTGRPNLCGIHVSSEGERLAFAATDGHRLHVAYVERATKGAAKELDAVIPSEGIEKLLAAWKPMKRHERLTLAFDGARFLTETAADGIVAVEPMVFGKHDGYPAWRKILPARDDRPPVATNPLLLHLDRFHALRGKSPAAYVKFTSGPVNQNAEHVWTLEHRTGDGFEARAVTSGTFAFEPFIVNPKLLADALTFCSDGAYHVHFQPGAGKSPIRLASLDDSRVAMVMPARL